MRRVYAPDLHYDKTNTDNSHTYPVLRVVLNVVIFVLLLVPSIYLWLWGYPTIRAFYCNDVSLLQAFRSSALDTFSTLALVFGLPIFLIVAFEAWRMYRVERSTNYRAVDYKVGDTSINRFFVRLFIFLGYFLLGAVFLLAIVDICRYSIGGMKPYFYSICHPNATLAQVCHSAKGVHPGPTAHIALGKEVEYCNNDTNDFKYARMSWPSWQSAFAWYSMIFIVVYIQARVYWTMGTHLVRPVIQFLCITLAVCISVGVVHSHQAHWYDVLGGMAIGTGIALLCTLFMARLFYRRELPDDMIEMHDESFPYYHHQDHSTMSTNGGTHQETTTRHVESRHDEKKIVG